MRTEYTKDVLDIIKKIKKDGGLRSELPEKYHLSCFKRSGGFKDVYGRMRWDDVAPTLTGGCTSASKGTLSSSGGTQSDNPARGINTSGVS